MWNHYFYIDEKDVPMIRLVETFYETYTDDWGRARTRTESQTVSRTRATKQEITRELEQSREKLQSREKELTEDRIDLEHNVGLMFEERERLMKRIADEENGLASLRHKVDLLEASLKR